MKFTVSPTPEAALTQHIASWISKNSHPLVILLSGGSAIQTYPLIWKFLPNNQELEHVTFSLVDERYGEIGHADSTETQIQDTGFINELKKRKGKWHSVLEGKNMDECAADMDEWLRNQINKTSTIFTVLGMGEDGHIAGMLPQKSALEFSQTFPENKLYLSYTVEDDYPNPYKQRLTATPKLLQQSTETVLFAKGESKKETLEKLKNSNQEIYKFPAMMLKTLTNMSVITDQKV